MSWLVQIARKSYLSSARLLPLCRIHFLCASAHSFLFTVIIITFTTDIVIIVITIPAIIILALLRHNHYQFLGKKGFDKFH